MKEVKKLFRKVSQENHNWVQKRSTGNVCFFFKVTFIWYRSNFQLVEKFDRALCSHETVQYFCAVDTELSSRNISKQSEKITWLVNPCTQYLFAIFLSFSSWVNTHPCSHAFAVERFCWSRCTHLAVQIFDRTLTPILAFKVFNG